MRLVALACLVAACTVPAAHAGTPTTTAPTTTATGAESGGRSTLPYIVGSIVMLLGATLYFRNRPGGYAGRRDDDRR